MRVPVVPTEMTFSVSRDRGEFEWAGKGLTTLFCQVQNLFRPGMWRMVWDILRYVLCGGRFRFACPTKFSSRFNASAQRLLEGNEEQAPDMTIHNTQPELSIGNYLQREGYSNEFIDDYLIVSR